MDDVDSKEQTLLDETTTRPVGDVVQLVALGDGVHTTYRLPASGTIVIGRADDCGAQIDHPSISRRHALVRCGAAITIEDLGSRNGTRVRGTPLAAHVPAPIDDGDFVALGRVMLAVQRVVARDASDELDTPTGAAATMRRVHDIATRVAPGDISVLILGETGVGKEVLARAIHDRSPRAKGVFLAINCAALSESLLDSELFGHEKGAFTGALAAKPGLLEAAQGGTVFLDEVGEMPPATQAKLLRVLEERRVRRVGGLQDRPIDVRFVAATNRDLRALVDLGSFRGDLYFRLNGVSLTVPPLRERQDEIEPLARAFATQRMRDGRVAAFSAEALSMLRAWSWPGNIRELRNVIERAVLLSGAGAILPEHLQLEAPRPAWAHEATNEYPTMRVEEPPPSALRDEVAGLERQRIVDALERCAGNQTHAAQMLGISRNTLMARLDAFGIARPRRPREPK